MTQQSSTGAPIAIEGQIQFNRGGHPFVVVYETESVLRELEAIGGRNRIGSSMSGGRTFYAPTTVTVNGVERVATGIGDRFYDAETTRERNPRNGKVKITTTRVEGSGRRYVYLQEQRVPVTAVPDADWTAEARRLGIDDWARPISDRPATGRGIDA